MAKCIAALVTLLLLVTSAHAQPDDAEVVGVAIDDLLTAKAVVYKERSRPLLDGTSVSNDEILRKLIAIKPTKLLSGRALTPEEAQFIVNQPGLRLTATGLEQWLVLRYGMADVATARRAVASYQASLGDNEEAKVTDSFDRLKELTGVDPTPTEIAIETGVSPERAADIRERQKELARFEKQLVEQSLFEQWPDAGFSLRRRLVGPEDGQAASFSVLHSAGEDTVYSANFALAWQEPDPGADIFFGWSIEGALTSDESEGESAIRVRGSMFSSAAIGTFDDLYLNFSTLYETDQDFDTHKLSLEVVLTPNVASAYIGVASGDYDDPLQFRWRPYVGVDAGYTFDMGDSLEEEDEILRLMVRVRAELFINGLRDALGLRRAVLFVDNTYRYLPLEDDDSRNFFETGLSFEFNPNVSLEVTYRSGETTPLFEEIETFGVALGVRF